MLAVSCGIYHCGRARADLLQCPYPNTYFYFEFVPGIGRFRGFVCDAPLEENGSHWHAELGGGGVSGSAGGNVAAPGFQGLNGGLPIGIEITLASATYRCPDQRYESDPPIVYGTWNKDRPKPKRCVPVRVSPTAPLAPWPPETDVNIKVSWPPESPPHPIDDLPSVPPYGTVQEQAPFVPPPADQPPLPNTRQGG